MFRVFHLAWSTCRATKTFVTGCRNATRWLVDLLGVSLMKNEQQRHNFKVVPHYTFCNNEMFFLRDKSILARKRGKVNWILLWNKFRFAKANFSLSLSLQETMFPLQTCPEILRVVANLHGREKYLGDLGDKAWRPCDMRSVKIYVISLPVWPPWIANVWFLSSITPFTRH